MIIRNTSRIPTSDLRFLMSFVKGFPRKDVELRVSKSKRWGISGCFYRDGYAHGTGSKSYYICVKVGGGTYPRTCHYNYKSDRFPTYEVRNDKERLVAVLAHEFQHLKDYRKKGRYGERCGELKPEKVAVRTLERYRTKMNISRVA